MITISFWKILLVLLVALIVLGPQQLPKAAHTLGKWLGLLRGSLSKVQKELSLLEEQKKPDSVNDNERN
jgi:sec-independent protein translocase protein TatB